MRGKPAVSAPQVSVVLPVYNVAAYLPLLLSSLLNQSLADIEIIAVDDGSTDNSLHLLREAASKDSRLTVLTQANGGLSAARNAALPHASGSWIAFVDSDDWLAPKALETWCIQGQAQQLDMVIGNGFMFHRAPDEKQIPLLAKQPWDEVITGREWIIRGEAAREWPHWVWLQLIRRELLAETGVRFIHGMLHEDSPWTLQLAMTARRIGFVREPLYGYRLNPASIVNTPNQGMLFQRARSHTRIVELLASQAESSRHEPHLERALLRYANVRCNHFRKLVGNDLRDAALKRELLQEFLALGGLKVMFRGSGRPLNFLRAIYFWLWALRV